MKSILALLLALNFTLPAMAQELSAEQQQQLNAVASGLSRVKTNLQLALEVAYLRTTYKNLAAGDDLREQFAVIYKY